MTIQEFAELHQSGKSLREIARFHNVSAGYLSKRLKEAGYSVRGRNEANALRRGRSMGGVVRGSVEWRQRDVTANLRLQRKKMQIVKEFRAAHPCEHCGESDPVVLDLHHPDPSRKHPLLKAKNGQKRTGGDYWRRLSFRDLEAELAKCQVLCANCHRRETYSRRAS